ncbi:MAG: precorrin-6A synthase (deacetylating) [Gammaproteobacteria bacterium]|nr:MAG: precorrin-6A synthase (deacetylating) [Gammaproteobacteria bacterium]
MIELVLVGIGTGNPDHLTREASRAIRHADLILVPLKGGERGSLAALRQRIIAAETDMALAESESTPGTPSPVVVEFPMPDRDPSISDYRERVDQWHAGIATVWEDTIRQHVGAMSSATVALLIWGDPSLYDSSLRITERLKSRLPLSCRVIPGITAIQALCAAHAIPLNTVGAPVHVTTGRRLARTGWPADVDTVVVMLDGNCAFTTLDMPDVHIWWGAYVAMEEEILISGPLHAVAREIVDTRARAREVQGWIMDIYLLRRG